MKLKPKRLADEKFSPFGRVLSLKKSEEPEERMQDVFKF